VVTAAVDATAFMIDGNCARDGTAVFGDRDKRSEFGDLANYFGSHIGLQGTGNAMGCERCQEIRGNFPADGSAGASSTISMEDESNLNLHDVKVQDNQGTHALRSAGSIALSTTLLSDNQVSGELIENRDDDDGEALLTIVDSTIAHNSIGASHVIFASDVISVLGTIFSETVVDTFDFNGSTDRTNKNLDYLLTNSSDHTVAFAADVLRGTPHFMDIDHQNYHLHFTSLGVDEMPARIDSNTHDLDANPRSLDVPQISDGAGPRDLGAYEVQLWPNDTIFSNEFGG